MQTLTELIERWNSPEGHPYKGSLIDWESYEADPTNIGCMCAQGQALHILGGWEPKRIREIPGQAAADVEVAKLLNISRGHAVLLRNVNDNVDGAPAIVLTDPGKVLGSEWSRLLDFWCYMDQMTSADWKSAAAAGDVAWAAAGAAAWAAAGAVAWDAAGDVAWDAAWDAARAAAWAAARAAAWEIQAAAIFKATKRPFYFLPMFGFAQPEDIPPRPANYGQ